MKKVFWIPLLVVIIFITVAGILASGNDLLIYSDAISLAISILPVFFIMLTCYTPKEMGHAFKQAMEETKFDRTEVEKSLVFFEAAQKIFIVMSLIGFIVGIISMRDHFTEAGKIGYAVSISILTALYSLIFIALITLPFVTALKKKIAEHSK